MNKRQYPVTESFFNEHISPLIEKHYSRAGRPRKVSHYQVDKEDQAFLSFIALAAIKIFFNLRINYQCLV